MLAVVIVVFCCADGCMGKRLAVVTTLHLLSWLLVRSTNNRLTRLQDYTSKM